MWHGFSWKFRVISRHKLTEVLPSKSTPNSMTISCQLSRLYLFSMLEHDMDFTFYTSSSHGISMVFAKKMMGFPSDLISFSTKLPSKKHEKNCVTFFTGIIISYKLLFCPDIIHIYNAKETFFTASIKKIQEF